MIYRTLLLLAVAVFAAGCHPNWPRSYERLQLTDAPSGTTGPTLTATWLGAAGLYVTDGQTSILVDPFVSRYGLAKVWLGFELNPKIELIEHSTKEWRLKDVGLIFVSHSHYDHAIDAPYYAAMVGGLLAGSRSTLNIGLGAGLPESRMLRVNPEKPIELGQFRIRVLKSRHSKALFGRVPYPGQIEEPLEPPASAGDYKLGEVYSLVVEHPLGSFLHHASAGVRPGMFKGVTVDTVFLGIAGREDTEQYLADVVDTVEANRIILTHFDNFFAPLDEPIQPLFGVDFDEFIETTKKTRPDVGVYTLPVGEPRVLFY